MASILQIKRGPDGQRLSNTFAQGEPIYVTDTKKLFVGDGITPGGVEIGGGLFKELEIPEERPIGTFNGINKEFRLLYPFISVASVKPTLNGLSQTLGVDNDFTLVWPDKIIMNEAPYQGDQLLVTYKTQVPL